MKQALLAAFDRDISACIIETSEAIIEVYEGDDLRSYIKTEPEHPSHFKLNNHASQSLTFAALDNCILTSTDLSRCDFIIGNFNKLFLVEIKDVKTKQRSAAKDAAIEQLKSTIGLLKEKINLRETSLSAVICIVGKTEVHPMATAAKSAKRVEFKETHGADLLEGQSADFLSIIE